MLGLPAVSPPTSTCRSSLDRETGEIEWFVLTPKFWRCNFTDLSASSPLCRERQPRRDPCMDELASDCHILFWRLTIDREFFDTQLHWRLGAFGDHGRDAMEKFAKRPVMELRRFLTAVFGTWH